jgi:hypothetical protein
LRRRVGGIPIVPEDEKQKSERRGLRRVENGAHHELWSWGAFAQTLFDEGVGEDDLSKLDRDVVLVGGPVLSNGWANANRRDGDVLPNELFWPAPFWMEAEQFTVLC